MLKFKKKYVTVHTLGYVLLCGLLSNKDIHRNTIQALLELLFLFYLFASHSEQPKKHSLLEELMLT